MNEAERTALGKRISGNLGYQLAVVACSPFWLSCLVVGFVVGSVVTGFYGGYLLATRSWNKL